MCELVSLASHLREAIYATSKTSQLPSEMHGEIAHGSFQVCKRPTLLMMEDLNVH